MLVQFSFLQFQVFDLSFQAPQSVDDLLGVAARTYASSNRRQLLPGVRPGLAARDPYGKTRLSSRPSKIQGLKSLGNRSTTPLNGFAENILGQEQSN